MDRLYPLTVTTPANTLASAPLNTPFPLEDAYLEYIHIIVPSGCVGLLAFRILWAGTQVIPWANNYFLTPDDEKIEVDFQEYMTITGLVIQSYNLDIFAHNIYIRALIKSGPLPGEPLVSVTGSSSALPTDETQTGTAGINTLTAPIDLSSGVAASLADQSLSIPTDVSQVSASDQIGPVPDTGPVSTDNTVSPVPAAFIEPVPPVPASIVHPPIVVTPVRKPVPHIRPVPPVKRIVHTSKHTMTRHKAR